MNKETKELIILSLQSLELRLLTDRQESQRHGDELDVVAINLKLDEVRKHLKELENDGIINHIYSNEEFLNDKVIF